MTMIDGSIWEDPRNIGGGRMSAGTMRDDGVDYRVL